MDEMELDSEEEFIVSSLFILIVVYIDVSSCGILVVSVICSFLSISIGFEVVTFSSLFSIIVVPTTVTLDSE